jgi:hypothetical protein
MIRVIIESPYAPRIVSHPEDLSSGGRNADSQAFKKEIEANIAYAKECVRDSLSRGEAPYASHLFFTQPGLLDDTIPGQRRLGIEAGLTWGEAAEKTVVYDDLGVSPGMRLGIEHARAMGRTVEFRKIRE